MGSGSHRKTFAGRARSWRCLQVSFLAEEEAGSKSTSPGLGELAATELPCQSQFVRAVHFTDLLPCVIPSRNNRVS